MKTIRKQGGFTLVEVIIVAAIIGLLAAIAIPSFIKARGQAQQRTCVCNIVQLDEAVDQWAIEKRKKAGDTVVEEEVFAYLKRGKPLCPAGGTYNFYTVGTSTAWCSYTSGDSPHSDTNAP